MARRRLVVIGAGVLGASLTDELARAGASVTLLDRDEPGAGTSRWSFAWLNSNGKTPRSYHDLSVLSLAAWARLARDLDGAADWYRPVGNLVWARPDQWPDLAGRVTLLRRWGYPAGFVPVAEAAELEPALRLPARVREVAWFPDEGYVLTEPLVTARLRRAADRGAHLRTGPAGEVVAVEERSGAGYWVRTADGGRIPADTVVCCAGRWTPEITGLTGAEVPLVNWRAPGSPAPALVVRVGPVAAPPQRLLHTPAVHVRAHGPGTAHLEAADATVDLHTPAAELDAWAGTLLRRARRVVPALEKAHVQARQVCVRPMPPDGLPLVGALPGRAGRYVVATHSGVTLAAGLAELVTAELLQDVRRPELAPYRPERLGPTPPPA